MKKAMIDPLAIENKGKINMTIRNPIIKYLLVRLHLYFVINQRCIFISTASNNCNLDSKIQGNTYFESYKRKLDLLNL